MGAGRHLLLIPDGSRRHARREYLRAMLDRSAREFEALLEELPPGLALRLRERITRYARDGADTGFDPGQPDVLDELAVELPGSLYLASYRRCVSLLDELVDWLLAEGETSVLSVYGMQLANLQRADAQACAFLRAEAECCEGWASSQARLERCTFRFVGDQSLLEAGRWRPALRQELARYARARERLARAAHGRDLVVNLLAPYDYEWEINQAIVAGRFERSALAVPESVDLVVRSGSGSRSVLSGALPCQSAFSQFAPIPGYFPECRLGDLQRAVRAFGAATRRTGL